jgi:hypothetical protein
MACAIWCMPFGLAARRFRYNKDDSLPSQRKSKSIRHHAFLACFSKISRRRSAGLNPRRSKSANIFLVDERSRMPSTALILANPTNPKVSVFCLIGLLPFSLVCARTILSALERSGIMIFYQNRQKISSAQTSV